MIYDYTMFNGEYDLLELRLETLNKFIDKFIIVEGDKTHSGIPKQSLFLPHCDRYSKFSDKLIHATVEMPDTTDRFAMDRHQRKSGFSPFISGLDNRDIVIVSDLDEIPDLLSWNGREGVFICDAYFFKMNRKHNQKWNGPCIVSGFRFINPYGKVNTQDVRNFRDLLQPVGRGWHFSWMQDPERKVREFAHAELDDGRKFDGWHHPGDGSPLVNTVLDNSYPQYLINNLDKFRGYYD